VNWHAFTFEVLLYKQGLFKGPKLHLKLLEGDFAKLKQTLEHSGYTHWKRGELTVDGVSFGWRESDLQYALIERNGLTYYAAVSEQLREVILLRFP